MSKTLAIPDIDLIEHLDFRLDPPCEHEQHAGWHKPDGPAVMIVRRLGCPHCGDGLSGRAPVILLCQAAWDLAAPPNMLQCAHCAHPDYRSIFWRYLGHLNP